MNILLPILGALLFVLLAAGFYFFRVAYYPKVLSVQRTWDLPIEHGHFDPDDYKSWDREVVTIPSRFGYTLYGEYYPLPGANKTVVLSHGITNSIYGQVKYMPIFRRLGYNLLAYDHRFHGRSGGSSCTFGYYEKHDLKTVVDYAFSRLPAGGKVGTQGESLGAGVTLQHAAIDHRIAFAIPDCPYSDLHALFTLRGRLDYHIPPFPLLNLSNLFSRILLGFTTHQVSPLKDAPSIKAPVLLIHGLDDTYIPPSMSQDIFAALPAGLGHLHLVPGAGHAEALVTDPKGYEQVVTQFLHKVESTWK